MSIQVCGEKGLIEALAVDVTVGIIRARYGQAAVPAGLYMGERSA